MCAKSQRKETADLRGPRVAEAKEKVGKGTVCKGPSPRAIYLGGCFKQWKALEASE